LLETRAMKVFGSFSVMSFCAVSCVGLVAQQVQTSGPSTTVASATRARAEQMRLTTTSPHARELFGQAIVLSGNYRLDECLKGLRSAVAADPNFAAGWALLAFYATDSREAAEALTQAQRLVGKATPSEMLLVHWIGALKRNSQLEAISNLNDLVHREDRDKYVAYLAGRWFLDQHDQQKAVPLFEKVLVLDPEFTPVLNRLGYAYAARGDLRHAEALMQRYVAAMPKDPNPEDSYGDILFKAGRYDEARKHFEAALRKDPSFGPSQHELGDVYAMIGEQDAARNAYEQSAKVAANPRRSLEYRSSIALLEVRQGQSLLADQGYGRLAAEAKSRNDSDLAATFYEAMALYQKDDAVALKRLDAAEEVLRQDPDLAAVTRDEHMAVIRRWRGIRSLHAGNPAMAEVCMRVLQQKYDLTENEAIGEQLHALRGAWLAEQGKYAEAVAELESIEGDAFSLDLLAQVKRHSGDRAGADAALQNLLAIHAATLESVLVVEPARQRTNASSASASRD
jgi:tetratricopeptide (TPR) repeat protein